MPTFEMAGAIRPLPTRSQSCFVWLGEVGLCRVLPFILLIPNDTKWKGLDDVEPGGPGTGYVTAVMWNLPWLLVRLQRFH